MKKCIFAFLSVFILRPDAVLACDVCEKNQPAALRGVTHGQGPGSDWDMLIISAAGIVVLVTLIYSLRYLIRPDEDGPEHIKNIVIEK